MSQTKYQILTDLEHILDAASDMYVGSLDKITEKQWILNEDATKFELKEITFSPALLKIYDEILVNARDQYIRNTDKVNLIKFIIDKEKGTISVYNNGPGFSIYQDKNEGDVWSVELVLTRTKSGQNFADKEKTTGGRYGYGAKLTVFFSKKFKITTIDPKNKIKYEQIYKNNSRIIEKPIITQLNKGDKDLDEPYTLITFIPDYERFGKMKGMENDIYKLFEKRAYDLSGCIGENVKIKYNGNFIPINNFNKYVSHYIGNTERIIEKCGERWEVIVCDSNYDDFMQVSFVNAINTYQGGSHVDYIVNQIIRKIKQKFINKGEKYKNITTNMIKNNIFIFINSVISDPTFTSQTKSKLEKEPAKFGSKCEIPDTFIDKMLKKLEISKKIMTQLTAKDQLILEKTSGKKSRPLIAKLEDANWAGGKKSDKCVLILTEGDSAAAFVSSGRKYIMGGNDRFGIFPLKGKLINVRSATPSDVAKNEEITNIKEILGLKHGKIYNSTSKLRYGTIMILADSDLDGSHIKGLIMNFIHFYWPSLMGLDFITTLSLPILKAKKGKDKKQIIIDFFSQSEYNKWKKNIGDTISQYEIKYYKGLGTYEREDAKTYFSKTDELTKIFKYEGKKDDEAMNLAFNKEKANERKEWLKKYDIDFIIDNAQKDISYSDFVNKELIHFSSYDNIRSIPNIIDGLKPSQRKVIFAAFRKNIVNEIKVAQFASYVTESTQYHHGDASIQETVIGLAQNFVGSNNIELLKPVGQLGTRLKGGQDAASPRYVFTQYGDLTRNIFDKRDFDCLKYIIDEGVSVEPEYYVPLIPMVLINGAQGIGTGYSTFVPNYDPMDIINNIENLLNEKKILAMQPYYRNFTGEIIKLSEGSYITKGKYIIIGNNKIKITELPVGVWTSDYKANKLFKLLANIKENKKKIIKKIEDNNSDIDVEFTIELIPSEFDRIQKILPKDGVDGFEKEFHLVTKISTTNMYLFNKNNEITKYKNTSQILREFFEIRLEFYDKRKEMILNKILTEIKILDPKILFIEGILDDKIKINNKKRDEIIKQLSDLKFPKSGEEDTELSGFGYLIKMPIYSLTKEKIQELKKQKDMLKKEYDELKEKTNKELYKEDLEILKKKYIEFISKK